jgi:leucyl aminopeptidase
MGPTDLKRPLELHLLGAGERLPDRPRITGMGDLEAALALEGEGAALHLSLPDRPRAELRWMVEQVLRRVSGLFGFERVELHATGKVAGETALTLALDLHNRTDGHVELPGREELADQVARVGALEDLYRDWVDEDPATRTSVAIASEVGAWADGRGDVEVEILGEDELRERGLELLLAVGQGSKASPPRLVLARHGTGDAPPLMLLGKGITFDTGGLNVKPYDAFVSMMKNDMAGAALAFALFRGLVEGGYGRPLALAIPTCENAVGPDSMRPGALIKSVRGHTVRVDHTDAEGRLILADALAYASKQWNPEQVICFATLTTAALIAYGPYATPVHFADPVLEARLRAAADATGEDLHFFPERIWHLEANRDQEADLRNTARLPGNAARGAGSRNAAHFLKHFTDSPLVHLDIFASTWNWAGDAPGAGYGATGAPLRTLLRALERDR